MKIIDDVRGFFDENRASEIPQNELEEAFVVLVGAPEGIHDERVYQCVQEELNRRGAGKNVASLIRKLSEK